MSSTSNVERKLAAIVFTDIVGFTEITANDQSRALDLLNEQRKLLQPLVKSYNGQWVKEMGDGLLLTFDTVTDAVNCSIKIQEKTKNIDSLNLRIGIHQGEIILQENDVIGDDVNIASRIESFSAKGGIAISNKVNDAIVREKEYETRYIGKPKLKGVSQAVEVYCIVSHQLPKTDISQVSNIIDKGKSKYNIFTITGGVFTIIGIAIWLNFSFLGLSFAGEEDDTYLRGKKSIAVMYFESFTPDRDIEFWCSGMTESVINALTKIGAFEVKSRNDVFKFKDQRFDFNQIRKDLNVNTFLQGSLQKFKDKLRISAQLIDAKTGNNLWAATYDRSTEDILSVQDDISQEIAKTLGIELELIQENILEVKPTENVKAYELLGKAIYLSDNGDNNAAIDVLDSVLLLDPNYKTAIYTKGLILEKQQNYFDAKKIFKNLLPEINEFSRLNWEWSFPELNEDELLTTPSNHLVLNTDLGIGVVSQKYKSKEYFYGIDIKNNKQIWMKSINDSYLSDSHIWEDLVINISKRFYPNQKGEAAIYANDITSGKEVFSLEFPREYPEQTIHPFLLSLENATDDFEKPFLVYLSIDQGSSLINIDPKNGKILWNIKLTDRVSEGLPRLWSVIGKNSKKFILHSKGEDLFLIDLANGAIKWKEETDRKIIVLDHQVAFYNKTNDTVLIKDLIKQKEIASYTADSPIRDIKLHTNKFIITTDKNLCVIDKNPGFFNLSLVDWDITIDNDDIISGSYLIEDNIFLIFESGIIWSVNANSGQIINQNNLGLKNLKFRVNEDVKKLICYNKEYVIGLDFYSGETIWKIYNNHFYNQPKQNIQFVGDKLIFIKSGYQVNDLIINSFNSLTGDLFWKKTEKSAILMKNKFFRNDVINDLYSFEDRIFIYGQNQIIELDITENPNDRIVPQKDVLLRLGSVHKKMNDYEKADSILNKILHDIDQQNEEAIRLLVDIYKELKKEKEFNSLIADYINLLPKDSNERMHSIELLKEDANLNWTISIDCIKGSIIDDKLIILDYQCDYGGNNQIVNDNSYKLISFRQHSGIMVWNTELDIDRSLFKLQDENNLYLLGQKNDDENDYVDWQSKVEFILISLNKNTGNLDWRLNLSTENSTIKAKKIYLKGDLVLIEYMVDETLLIKAVNSKTGELKWERSWDADSFYMLNDTELTFYDESILMVLYDEIISLNLKDGKDFWSYELEDIDEVSYFKQNGIFDKNIIFMDDEDEIVLFDLEKRDIIWSNPSPLDDVFKIRINHFEDDKMYFHIPDGRIYAFSFETNKLRLIWELDLMFPTEWIDVEDNNINILDVNENKVLAISINNGKIISEQYLIWYPKQVHINNSSIYTISDNNLYSQEQFAN